MRERTEADGQFSDVGNHKCRECGERAWVEIDGSWHCFNDPDCLAAMQEEADCAGEGYAVFGSDQ